MEKALERSSLATKGKTEHCELRKEVKGTRRDGRQGKGNMVVSFQLIREKPILVEERNAWSHAHK